MALPSWPVGNNAQSSSAYSSLPWEPLLATSPFSHSHHSCFESTTTSTAVCVSSSKNFDKQSIRGLLSIFLNHWIYAHTNAVHKNKTKNTAASLKSAQAVHSPPPTPTKEKKRKKSLDINKLWNANTKFQLKSRRQIRVLVRTLWKVVL